MEVEIWSDVVCPFCYLGKRNFEKALEQFSARKEVNITWKSFQLLPDVKTQPGVDMNRFLARAKGISEEQARMMHGHVTELGRKAGITYRFDRAVVANTWQAHLFLHFSKKLAKQTETKERLFKAYFYEGKNIDGPEVISGLALELGMDAGAWAKEKDSALLSSAVKSDIEEARQMGVRGVPFFLFDRKYAVSGAREPEVFLQALKKSTDK